jgi:serine/threonine-protein kinase PknK
MTLDPAPDESVANEVDSRRRASHPELAAFDRDLYLGRIEAALERLRAFEWRSGEQPASRARSGLLDVVRGADLDAAIRRLEDSSEELDAAEALPLLLDGVVALLDAETPLHTSVATALLARARRRAAEVPSDDENQRWIELLGAVARCDTGDAERELAPLRRMADEERSPELAYRAALALGRALESSGEPADGARARASELLDELAMRVPRPLRADFVRSRGTRRTPSSSQSGQGSLGRFARLLEITRRLAAELDQTRLLERITESAVELSGAERGFVLLVGDDGALAPATVRDAKAPLDPHIAFSRSIAEASLIDGEPIVTMDARTDPRLAEYVSVHRLLLQSVACIPIRDAHAVRGVLYVEHRVRRGRFTDTDVEMLLALADQAAIALSNARWIAERERERAELERAKDELLRANEAIERLLSQRTEELDRTVHELGQARRDLQKAQGRFGIVGRSEPVRKILQVVERISESSVPVVIHGESGTGKELFARAIHDSSRRARKRFVAVNCGAVSETLLESELFGHVRGAFTGADRDRTGVFAQADGGTLFLDEIGDMPARMQVELLRVLADGWVRPLGSEADVRVDVRIVCASNKNLHELVRKGLFREDLLYRLAVVELTLPALRERPDDIPLLASHLLERIASREDGPKKTLSAAALARLRSHPFPGNVRQLEHVLMNAWVMSLGTVLKPSDFAAILGEASTPVLAVASSAEQAEAGREQDASATNLDEWKAKEKARILEALEQNQWNRVRAAEQLGMPRRTFYRRLKDYGILG